MNKKTALFISAQIVADKLLQDYFSTKKCNLNKQVKKKADIVKIFIVKWKTHIITTNTKHEIINKLNDKHLK